MEEFAASLTADACRLAPSEMQEDADHWSALPKSAIVSNGHHLGTRQDAGAT